MINLYGILISFSVLACIVVAEKLVEKSERNVLWGLGFWTVLCGIIGARVYHVLSLPNYYFENPLRILLINNGGLGIWGGIIGGVLGSAVYLSVSKKNILHWLDLICVVLPLGQAIGRWGNYFNKEIYGKPTNSNWGLLVNGKHFHPLFLYESILDFILFSVLFYVYKKKVNNKTGTFLFLYLLGYSTIRFFLEFLRIDPWTVFGLNVSQCISILLIVFSLMQLRRTATK